MRWLNRHRGAAALRGLLRCVLAVTLACGVFGMCFRGVESRAQAALPRQERVAPLGLGAAWYPEQWPESRWEADLQLMQDAHITFVRVGEFAWSSMEPAEGKVDIDWLARAVRAAEKHHIAVVMCTPGPTPPAWLTQAYPQTLRIKEDGRRDEHGNREQFNFTDRKYRELLRGITVELAKRFGHDANVIAWQLDNEIGTESYGEDTRLQFQDWLHAKYKTLDNLNTRWTTAYWSETYQDWRQIPIEESYGNPGLLLNWKQFVSDTWHSYLQLQIEVIRANAEPRQIITTNTMGWFDSFDHYKVSAGLDFTAWDDYVGHGHLDPVKNGATHDLSRGLLRKNFWVMETQPGMVNWAENSNMLDKGEVRAMAWHAIGHGAEAVEYWQWRSALNGQEQYHGTLIGADGTPVPLYQEVQQVGAEFAKAGPALAGTTVESQVAVLHDYDSRWAINWQRHNRAWDPVAHLTEYYGALRGLVRSVDVVGDTSPLDRYKLVVAPGLNLLTPAAAENLKRYVQGGGHLVLTQRSAMKDEDNSLFPERQPGPLLQMLGARVEQWYALEKPVPIEGEWGSGSDEIWAEQMKVTSPEVKVLMRYGKSNGWLDGQPAAVTRSVGKGSITYIGAGLDAAVLAKAAAWMLRQSGLTDVLPGVPAGVDVAIRSAGARRVIILTNYAAEVQTFSLPGGMTDVLTGAAVSRLTLGRYEVAVLEAGAVK